jgi:hypothetical protein
VPIPAKNQDAHAVANAGLLLPATLGQRLGIEAIVDQLVNPGDRLGHHRLAVRRSRGYSSGDEVIAWTLAGGGCG